MTEESSDGVTALVILRGADAGLCHSGAPIQRTNLSLVTPDLSDADTVTSGLEALGFEVGPLVGVSMSITTARSQFESAFGVELHRYQHGWSVLADDEAGGVAPVLDVPFDRLEPEIAQRIESVLFEPPRDLHEEPSWDQ